VEVSPNDADWYLQATYEYYLPTRQAGLHGPLKRVVYAPETLNDVSRLQGVDYTYTLQGWLKSINPPVGGQSTEDPASARF
jgi:hypothetical protein